MVICFISVCLLCIFWKGLKLYEFNVGEISLDNKQIEIIDNSYAYDIHTNYHDKNIYMYGWFIKKGHRTIPKTNMNVVLRNTENNKTYIFPTEVVERKDVTEFFNKKENFYDWSGFISRKDKIDISNGVYEIFILYEYIDTSGIVKLKENIIID